MASFRQVSVGFQKAIRKLYLSNSQGKHVKTAKIRVYEGTISSGSVLLLSNMYYASISRIMLASWAICGQDACISRGLAQMIEEDEPSGKAKGGHVRAEKLPPERRSEIAKQAAEARWGAEPLPIVEDAETGDRFVLYTKPNGIDFQLRFIGEEPWATQKQMADLFGIDVKTVNQHLRHIFADGELDKAATISKYEIVQTEGARPVKREVAIYSLDCILAVGYRAGSHQAMLFRRWATNILRQYLINGFVIDVPRMKDPQRNDRLDELLEIIEEIRTAEANVWKQILDLVSYCSDYHLMTKQDKENYFATFQNAMHWAVAGSTAAEIRHDRVDAAKPYAGLTHFKGEQPTVRDGDTAKNILGEDEIKRLNMITNLALNFLKSQAEQGRLVSVHQYTQKLREIIELDGRPLIDPRYAPAVYKKQADEKVSREIKAYRARIKDERMARNAEVIIDMVGKARELAAQPRKRRK
jgi:hypothetical protein